MKHYYIQVLEELLASRQVYQIFFFLLTIFLQKLVHSSLEAGSLDTLQPKEVKSKKATPTTKKREALIWRQSEAKYRK